MPCIHAASTFRVRVVSVSLMAVDAVRAESAPRTASTPDLVQLAPVAGGLDGSVLPAPRWMACRSQTNEGDAMRGAVRTEEQAEPDVGTEDARSTEYISTDTGHRPARRGLSRRELVCTRASGQDGSVDDESGSGGPLPASDGEGSGRPVVWAVVIRGQRGPLVGVIGFFGTRSAARIYARGRRYPGAFVLPAMHAGAEISG